MKKWILDKERALAKTLLKKKYAKEGKNAPPGSQLERDAEKIADDANRILKERGKRILKDLKQTAREFWKEAKKP